MAIVGFAVVTESMPPRLGYLAFAFVAATLVIGGLGMVRLWFQALPPTFGEDPAKAAMLWAGALFFDWYLLFAASMVIAGLDALMPWR
jgi:hypothetical protein